MSEEYHPPHWMFSVVAVLPDARHDFYRWADGRTVEHVISLPDDHSLAFPTGRYHYSRISRRDDGEVVEYRLEAPRPGNSRIHQSRLRVGRWAHIRLIKE